MTDSVERGASGRPEPDVTGRTARGRRGRVAGLLAAAVALGVAELATVVLGAGASPVVAVGGALIDAAPQWLKNVAISTFGSADKPLLVAGILIGLALAAARLGDTARERLRLALLGVIGLGASGAAAALSRPDAPRIAMLPSLLGALAGGAALTVLVRAIHRDDQRDDRSLAEQPGSDAPPPGPVSSRRSFLRAGLLAGGVAVAAAAGAWLPRLGRGAAAASRARVRIPPPASRAAAVPAGAALDVPGISPLFTPNRDFYRVDTALLVPQVTAEEWTLRVRGMVQRELRLDYADLLARPLVERDLTLACVSNEVGGPYVGTARWVGVPLAPLLREAGVDPAADQLVSRSADGFTAGTPTAAVLDGRDALLAVAMNGEPLPPEHGFPVRMIVPGLFGYVSATKWLVELELTTFAAFDAYWVPRGWAERAPVETMTRIDTPRSGQDRAAGGVVVAGVAWAPHRGIRRVEVRVDEGPWQQAELAAPIGDDAWRQWRYTWSATPGTHRLQARATDGTGAVQTGRPSPPAPDGATGWHTVEVTVT